LKAIQSPIRRYEFGFPYLDTSVLVETDADEVVIRITRDTFSPERKAAFVRELIAEGFIPEKYRWFGSAEAGAYQGIRWEVDYRWLEIPPVVLQEARRFGLRLLFGAGLLWIGLMAMLLFR